ncbi:MAG TPA: peptidylprolyl isomerase [Gemmatimonadales bacterium]|nr:peptidylprolyl isomerase [Gemmatimonadales bacterium]
MHRVIALAAAGLLVAACQKPKQEPAGAAATVQPGQNDSLPVVVLETTKGRIVMQLDRKAAPLTVANILAHVNAHFYDGLVFHRVVRGFVIQAGVLTAAGMEKLSNAPPVPNEADNGLKNVRGSVGLAREMDPQSGGVQFYINLADNSAALDFRAKDAKDWGYAVFGKVTAGMDVVDKIAAVRTVLQGNYTNLPVEPVIITKAYVQTGT